MPKLNRFWKIILGIATFFSMIWPLVIMMLFFVMPLMLTGPDFIAVPQDYEMENREFVAAGFGFIFLIMLLMFFFMIVLWAVMIFYIIHLLLNEQTNKTLRVILGLGFYIMPYLAWPAYYLIYILPETPPDWALLEKPRVTRKRRTA